MNGLERSAGQLFVDLIKQQAERYASLQYPHWTMSTAAGHCQNLLLARNALDRKVPTTCRSDFLLSTCVRNGGPLLIQTGWVGDGITRQLARSRPPF